MDNPMKTEREIKNGQSNENRKGNQEWTIQKNPGILGKQKTGR